MLLALDIGNTDITVGLYRDGQWTHVWRMPSATDLPSVYFGMKLRDHFFEHRIAVSDVRTTAISSVVPDLTDKLIQATTTLFDKAPVVLGPALYARLPIKVMNPFEIGSDLVCNALAAYLHFNSACIVVDFGTALTFTTLSDGGEILGVSIAPGLKTAIRSLSQNTARLFDVPLEMPASVLGRGTVHAIQAGVLVGYEGMVKNMLQRIRQEVGNAQMPAVATGGLSSIIATLHAEFAQVDPTLTLNGLRLSAQYA